MVFEFDIKPFQVNPIFNNKNTQKNACDKHKNQYRTDDFVIGLAFPKGFELEKKLVGNG